LLGLFTSRAVFCPGYLKRPASTPVIGWAAAKNSGTTLALYARHGSARHMPVLIECVGSIQPTNIHF
jgi:hypothetical protein